MSPADLSARTGVSKDLVAQVAAAVGGATVRAGIAEDVVLFTTALSAELEACAKLYTGCAKTEELVFEECLEFVIARFGFLNIGEVRHAFRLAAAGELGDVDLKAYWGTFTVGMLGSVLSAYKDYRDLISAEAVRLEKVANEQKRLSATNHDREAWMQRRIQTLLMLHEPTIIHVTAYDYEFLTQLGHINLSKEQKWAVFERAKELVLADLSSNMQTAANAFRKKELYGEIEAVRAGNVSEGFLVKQKVFAQRLAVLDWAVSQKVN